MARILLFTGKGGVGKTTCAAATALRAAERGIKTLVLSSDPAHSLGDALDQPLGPEPVQVVPNLFAQEVDLYYSMRKYWGRLRELMMLAFRWQGVDAVASEELAALPGMGEGSVLLWLDQFYHESDYDLIVVDSAPTGETLTFLSLPQATEWWLTRAFPFQKLAVQTVGFALRKTTGIPLDKGYAELQYLFERLKIIQGVLADPAISSVRLVMNPEKMVIREARRAYTYLQLYGYGVDAVVVNRVMPDAAGPAWEGYLEAQRGYMNEIQESFAPLPILSVPHRMAEVFGLEGLRHVATDMYGKRDPAAVLHTTPGFSIERDAESYCMRIPLPLVETEDVSVIRRGDQLVLQIGNQRRLLLTPSFLSFYRLDGYAVEASQLVVRFEPETEKADGA